MQRIFLILTFVSLLEVKEIENSFDYIKNIYYSNNIIPYTDEKGNLYVVTGEYTHTHEKTVLKKCLGIF